MASLPFSQSCENNKGPILEVLREVFADRSRVLEVASGSGQHATWFAAHLPHLLWQPTEIAAALPVLLPRCTGYQGVNLAAPLPLDVSERPWAAVPQADAVFTANSLHIMPWESVEDLFAELAQWAGCDTILAVYGPFNYRGNYTSPSNARFDQWLAAQSACSAIRDFEAVTALANKAGFQLLADKEMPANNRLLSWRKVQ